MFEGEHEFLRGKNCNWSCFIY